MPKKSKKKKFTKAEIATRRVDPRYDPRFQRGSMRDMHTTMRNPSDYTQIGDHGGVHRPTPFRRANFGDRGMRVSDPFARVRWGDNGGVVRSGGVIGTEAEGPIGIHNQNTGLHRGTLGPMLSGQNQDLTGKPFQVITGATPLFRGRGIFPPAHLKVFPTPSI